MAKILLVSKELAEKYIIDTNNLTKMCRHNRLVAERVGRSDLVQCWSLCEMIATPLLQIDSDEDYSSYSQNPFGKNLLESL